MGCYVNAGNNLQPYVVKLFETNIIDYKDSVTNEVLGNVLAKEFNLPVPKAALIDMDEDFVNSIRNFELLEILESRDYRIKFGTSLLEGFYQFDSASFDNTEAKSIIDIDNVFAFDNLIRNSDRNVGRSNILIRSSEAYLIDHELSFELPTDLAHNFKYWDWDGKFYKNHIFYSFLKKSIVKHKKEYFNEFGEYLKLIDINLLQPYFNQLISCGFSNAKHQFITDYLTQMKENSTKFVNIMKRVIV